jgi:hypothetical protein
LRNSGQAKITLWPSTMRYSARTGLGRLARKSGERFAKR